MPDLTNDQIIRVLGKFMGWSRLGSQWNSPWGINNNGYYIRKAEYDWSPPTDRNDLSEVLAKLTPEQWAEAKPAILRNFLESEVDQHRWLLTCDPAIIARAVAEVVSK